MRKPFGAKPAPQIIIDRSYRPRNERVEFIVVWSLSLIGCIAVLYHGVSWLAGMAP